MQNQPIKKHQNLSKTFGRGEVFKKVLISILIIHILIAGYVLWCMYMSKRPPITYQGIELFVQEKYLEYEKGKQFKAYIDEKAAYLNGSTVTDFRYCDFKKREGIWGKYTDYYFVEYVLGTEFDSVYDMIRSHSKSSTPYETWTLFYTKSDADKGFYIFANEQTHKIRIMYLTDCGRWQITRFIFINARNIDWG